MNTKRVVVLPYDPKWKSDFENIRREIESAIGDLIVGIEHVGSTSVEGLSAKPCIDIDVVIKDYSVFDEVIEKLGAIGYIYVLSNPKSCTDTSPLETFSEERRKR